MMYRRHAAQHSAKHFEQIATTSQPKGSIAQFFAMVSQALMDHAWQMNRRHDRAQKRYTKSMYAMAAGLNGEAAMARRRRQIARGQLKAENGLVV
jgi:hypothetical protein